VKAHSATLGDICELKYGKSLPTSLRQPGSVKVYGSNGPVGHHVQELVRGPAIVVGRKGSYGEVHYSEGPLWPIDTTYYIDANSTDCDLRWLHYLLKHLPLTTLNKAAAIPGLNREDAYRLPILLPSLDEQRRIAAILDKADALRRKRKRVLHLLDSLNQSVFLDMFGQATENPNSFPTCFLGDICEFRGGSQPPKSVFSYEPGSDRVRLIQIRDYKSDAYATYIPKSLAKRPCSETDVMIGRYGPPLFQILKGLSGSYNVALMKADPKPEVTRAFLFYLLKSPKLQADVISQSERSAGQTGVNLKFLNAYPAYRPPASLQAEFEKIVDRQDPLQRQSKAAMNLAEDIFTSLQTRAFSGQL
jgi:type I restriction enzyme S subunit